MSTERRTKQLENIAEWKARQVAVAEDRLERAIAEVEVARRSLQVRQAALAEATAKVKGN